MDTQQQKSLARLKGLAVQVQRPTFLAELPLVLSLIFSNLGQAQVDQDFLLEFRTVSDLVEVERISINMLSAQEIADGIAKANGHVVVLIRSVSSVNQSRSLTVRRCWMPWPRRKPIGESYLSKRSTPPCLIGSRLCGGDPDSRRNPYLSFD